MVGPQAFPMRHSEQRYASASTVLVHLAFHIYANRRCTLVKDRELWFVVEQTRHL